MLNYYDEMKEAIEEELKYGYKYVLENAEDKEDAHEKLEEIFFLDDAVTGNASGSYYFNAYESRKHCYEYSDDVKEALDMLGSSELLEKFKQFEFCIDCGYVDIETMEVNADLFDEYEYLQIVEEWEEINDLNFEVIDVVTRCFLLGEVLIDVLDEMYKC